MVHLIAPVEEPLDPIDALRRVAFLMERTRAGSYRVEAFRKAVKTLKALAPGELDRQVDAGTLQEIPGIGKSTAGVIEAAARGETAAYLSGLEEKSGGPLTEGGEELCVIGGGQVYALALPRATHLHLTHVDTVVDGADAFFPRFDPAEWRETARTVHPADAAHAFAFACVDYERA